MILRWLETAAARVIMNIRNKYSEWRGLMACYHQACSFSPLRDNGLVEFAAEDQILRKVLEDTIAELDTRQEERQPLAMRYERQEPLLRLIGKLQNRFPSKDANRIQFRVYYETEAAAIGDEENGELAWMPLAELFGDIGGTSIPDYILHRNFTLHLQPVVKPNGEAVGYEFLTRPLPDQMPFRPGELFEKARKSRLHAFLDRAARQAAIRMGAAHLAPGLKRFVNFLPSSLHRPDLCLRGTFDEIRQTGTDPGDCVFEVMESEPLDDPKLLNVFEAYRSEGIRLALDDVGKGFATLDVVERLQPDYVKIDRRWVSNCDTEPVKQRYIGQIMDRVSRFHGVVLAEGVERQEEWTFLKQVGVPLFQGYLFGRAMPVPSFAPVAAG
jgi:EAL domain-containing protein (putative c-di-GMP-specific phosphodiesterase class I)